MVTANRHADQPTASFMVFQLLAAAALVLDLVAGAMIGRQAGTKFWIFVLIAKAAIIRTIPPKQAVKAAPRGFDYELDRQGVVPCATSQGRGNSGVFLASRGEETPGTSCRSSMVSETLPTSMVRRAASTSNTPASEPDKTAWPMAELRRRPDVAALRSG
jgi:hypothetical protein